MVFWIYYQKDNTFVKENDVTYCDLETLLKSADIVSIHLNLSDQTKYLIDQEKIKSQSLSYDNSNRLGLSKFEYTQERIENNTILEIGSNDGNFLKELRDKGYKKALF